MRLIPSNSLLRAGLLGDAAASGAMGLVLVAAAYPMASLLALPEPLLRGAGLVFVPYAVLVAWLGTRPTLPYRAVLGVVGINVLYVVDSVLLLLLGLVSPNGLGVAFVLGLAAAVMALALLQWAGLRQGAAQDAAMSAA